MKNPATTKKPLLVATCLLLVVFPVFGNSMTLEQAVRALLQHEPELMAVDADSRSSYHDFKMSKSAGLPTVSLTSDSGYSRRDRSTDAVVQTSSGGLYSRDIGISIRQLLYDGGQTKCRTAAAKEAYRAQRLLQMGIIEARVVDMAEVYMELIRLEDQLRAARENVSHHKEFRSMLVRREQQGGVRSDTSLIDGRLSLAENALATIHLSQDIAYSRFKRLTGTEPGALTRPKVPLVSGNASSLNLSGNWDYLAACATLKSATASMNAVKATHKPNFYFDAGATEGYDTIGVRGRDRDFRAIVGARWDLYQGGLRKSQVCREHWQVERARDLLRAADETRRHIVRDLFSEREGSTASRRSLEHYVLRLESVAEDYEKQFSIGNRELLNLLDIKNEQYQASTQLIDAKFNEEMSNYRLLGAQGKLIARLIGSDFSKYIGTGCSESDQWWHDAKKGDCACRKLEDCGEPRCKIPLACPVEEKEECSSCFKPHYCKPCDSKLHATPAHYPKATLVTQKRPKFNLKNLFSKKRR